MRTLFAFLAVVLVASTAHGASPSPPKAPTSLAAVACRVDDWTGKRPLPENVMPVDTGAYKWHDLELHVEHGELECKVVPMDNLQDSAMYSKLASKSLVPLDPDFGDWTQCSRAAAVLGPEWDQKNPGWATVAVGCPTPIGLDEDGDGRPDIYMDGPYQGQYKIKSWKMPSCPDYFPGTNTRMKCRYTASDV